MHYTQIDHPFVKNLLELPAVSRLSAALKDHRSTVDTAKSVGPVFLRIFPSNDRPIVSEALGHMFGELGAHHGTPVDSSIGLFGPGHILMSIPYEERKRYILTHEADFEDFLKEIPEYLLLLPEQDRRAVSDMYGGVGQQYLPKVSRPTPGIEKQAALTASLLSTDGNHGSRWVESVNGRQMSWPTASTKKEIKTPDGKVYKAHVPLDNFATYTGGSGKSKRVKVYVSYLASSGDGDYHQEDHEYYTKGPEDADKPVSVLSKDKKTLTLWDEVEGYVDVPLADVRYLAFKQHGIFIEVILPGVPVDGDTSRIKRKDPVERKSPSKGSTTDSPGGDTGKEPGAAQATGAGTGKEKTPYSKTLAAKGQGITAKKIIEDLSGPGSGGKDSSPQVEIVYYVADSNGIVTEEVTHATSFPSGVKDADGVPRTFGQEIHDGVVTVYDVREQKLREVPVSGIKKYELYDAGFEFSLMQSHPLGHKKLEDVAHLQEYDIEYSKMKDTWSSKVMALIDTETVGLLAKAYSSIGSGRSNTPVHISERYKTSEAQLLQIAGLRIQASKSGRFESTSPFKDDGMICLSQHNLRTLLHEVESNKIDDSPTADALTDTLHYALSLIHRKGFSFEEEDVLGDPEGAVVKFPYARKQGFKTVKKPKNLNMDNYLEVLQYEAGALLTELQSLKAFVEWVEDIGAEAFCGHNAYSFDKRYILARMRVYPEISDKRQVMEKPFLDTMHLIQIMFHPAISTLAYAHSDIKDKETGEGVPTSVIKEAQSLSSAIKNHKLEHFASVMGYTEGSLGDAHNAFTDINITLHLLNAVFDKMESWDRYLLGSQHYKKSRRQALYHYAKKLDNAERRSKK